MCERCFGLLDRELEAPSFGKLSICGLDIITKVVCSLVFTSVKWDCECLKALLKGDVTYYAMHFYNTKAIVKEEIRA